MDIRFVDHDLERLEVDSSHTAGLSGPLVKAFRKKVWQLRAATDERDLRGARALRFEKLDGSRQHQYSIRLNDQYRLILEIEVESSRKVICVMGIEDYH